MSEKIQPTVFTPGTIIANRYEIISYIGEGSMGQVYCARHTELHGHIVAMKVLFPEFAEDRTYTERFKNEIFASYGVFHPNVVRAYEYMRDGDIVAFTMEFIEGTDLGVLLDENPTGLPIEQIVNLLTQMCAGVHAIHETGIIHRDLKPENILIRKDGMVKIADFGIARVEKSNNLTEHGSVVGTLNYVSPEYLLENKVDWRSDIYAMGVLAYEMLTGQLPWGDDSIYNTMTQRLNDDPPSIIAVRPDCPAELERIVFLAMHRKVEQRYQSAADMFQDLQAIYPDPNARLSSAYMQVSKKSTVDSGAEKNDSWLPEDDSTQGTKEIDVNSADTVDFSFVNEIREFGKYVSDESTVQTIAPTIASEFDELKTEIADSESTELVSGGTKLDQSILKSALEVPNPDIPSHLKLDAEVLAEPPAPVTAQKMVSSASIKATTSISQQTSGRLQISSKYLPNVYVGLIFNLAGLLAIYLLWKNL